MMPSRPPTATGIFLMNASVFRSNIVTVESPRFVVKPWFHFGTSAAPWAPGVFGMSPRTCPVAPSMTMKWVSRETKTRLVPGSATM